MLFDGTIEAPREEFPALLVSPNLEIGVQKPVLSLERDNPKAGTVYAVSEGPLFLCARVNGSRTLICVRGGVNYHVGKSYLNAGVVPELFEVGEVELRVLPAPVKVVGY